MKKETYQNMMKFWSEHKMLTCILHMLNQILTMLVFIAYPVLLIYFFVQKDFDVSRAIIVPLNAFIILSLVRYLVARERPYEKFETPPAVSKKTKGKSFPSRHVFSVFVIAMTYFCLSPWWGFGVILMGVGVLLAAVRVLMGVHFISDVIAGAVVGILAGVIGYILFSFF